MPEGEHRHHQQKDHHHDEAQHKIDALATIVKEDGEALSKMLVDAATPTASPKPSCEVITIASRRATTRAAKAFVRVYCADNAAAMRYGAAMKVAKMAIYIGDDIGTMSMDRRPSGSVSGALDAEAATRSTWAEDTKTGVDDQADAFDAFDEA